MVVVGGGHIRDETHRVHSVWQPIEGWHVEGGWERVACVCVGVGWGGVVVVGGGGRLGGTHAFAARGEGWGGREGEGHKG